MWLSAWIHLETYFASFIYYLQYNVCDINSWYTYYDKMSDQEVTRWQHNRIYPQPINLCKYKNDLIYHLQISIYITIFK